MPLLPSRRCTLWGATCFALSAAFASFCAPSALSARAAQPPGRAVVPAPGAPLRALLVGGGPNRDDNPVAIESNLRYLHKLLGIKGNQESTRPVNAAGTTTLFADGSAKMETVLFQSPYASPGDELLNILLDGHHEGGGGQQFRAPQLASCEGPSTKAQIDQSLQTLARTPDKGPLMLYFTGHGGSNRADLENNFYMLWKDDKLTVRDLAGQMKALPSSQRVALIMVQCFSGSFANLLFEGGDPNGAPIDRDFAGYFAATKERVAAGCTPEVNEAEYHDFTSYFFAALSGRDRLGRKVPSADYNKDGQVGMDEAYAYSQINDESVDVPVRTLDAFVRRFSTVSEEQIFTTPFSQIQAWADPSQRAALDALSGYLKVAGEDRLSQAWQGFQRSMRLGAEGGPARMPEAQSLERRFEAAKARLLAQFPDLKSEDTTTHRRAEGEAVQWINTALAQESQDEKRATPNVTPAVWTPLVDTLHQLQAGQSSAERQEIEQSHQLRFVRLGKTIVLQHDLATNGTPDLQARMARLLVAERRTLPLKADF